MTDQHPITPPPELVQQLADGPGTWLEKIISAYRAGANMELEACCEWLRHGLPYESHADCLRLARRPKPPSLKEQALAAFEHILDHSSAELGADTVRRALEQLDD